jgi:selenide,water dikinase
MGGKPLMAIAILGWPMINKSLSGCSGNGRGRRGLADAGIIAGGHSINPEPIFGLAVTGSVVISNLKRNDKAESGSVLYLTKPLGVGILRHKRKAY